MVCAYIYPILFKIQMIYILAKQNNINDRLRVINQNVFWYVVYKLNGNLSNVCIDVIDSVDMDEDFTHY